MQNRIERVIENMKKMGLSQLMVADPMSIRYLTGIYVEPYERLFAFLIRTDGQHVFFLNHLFTVPKTPYQEVWFSDTDDSIGLMAAHVGSGRLGIDKTWAARFLIPLVERTCVTPVLASAAVDDCRAIKDTEEQRLMKEASRINDVVIEKAFHFIKAGMSEKQAAEFIDRSYIEEGAQGTSFTTIVSFGANAADPHHEPDETILQDGECVLIDMGCVYKGYCSDMTRTFICGVAADPEFGKVHELVRQANEKAENLIRPGVKLSAIDAEARKFLAAAGYEKEFNHRLGHFIGQTDHEQGDVSSVNENTVEPGMIFSIEPGVYLEGRFGVRIEDLVLVTRDGCEILNHVDKHLCTIPATEN